MQDPATQLPRISLPRTPVNKGEKRGRPAIGGKKERGASCSWGALLLTPCFLALPLAFLPLLLPHLLAFLSLLLPHLLTVLPLLVPDLPAFLALLRLLPALVLRFVRILLRLLLVGSLICLLWVRSTIHAVLPLVGFASSRCSCSQQKTGATLFPPVRRSRPRRGHNTSSAHYRILCTSVYEPPILYIRSPPA